MFFWKGPDARFGSKIAPKGDHSTLTFRPLFGTSFQRAPPSVKSTLKVTFFMKKYHSFPMCFALYAVCSRRYTHEKHIKKTLSSDSAGSDWLSLADTRQVKFKEQISQCLNWQRKPRRPLQLKMHGSDLFLELDLPGIS